MEDVNKQFLVFAWGLNKGGGADDLITIENNIDDARKELKHALESNHLDGHILELPSCEKHEL